MSRAFFFKSKYIFLNSRAKLTFADQFFYTCNQFYYIFRGFLLCYVKNLLSYNLYFFLKQKGTLFRIKNTKQQ